MKSGYFTDKKRTRTDIDLSLSFMAEAYLEDCKVYIRYCLQEAANQLRSAREDAARLAEEAFTEVDCSGEYTDLINHERCWA